MREGVTSAAAARGISMLDAAAAVRPAVNCMATGLLSFWALQETTHMPAQQQTLVRSSDHADLIVKRRT